MNCYTGKDLARAYRTVRENTIQIAEVLVNRKLLAPKKKAA